MYQSNQRCGVASVTLVVVFVHAALSRQMNASSQQAEPLAPCAAAWFELIFLFVCPVSSPLGVRLEQGGLSVSLTSLTEYRCCLLVAWSYTYSYIIYIYIYINVYVYYTHRHISDI